jgi:hypothetical protein
VLPDPFFTTGVVLPVDFLLMVQEVVSIEIRKQKRATMNRDEGQYQRMCLMSYLFPAPPLETVYHSWQLCKLGTFFTKS